MYKKVNISIVLMCFEQYITASGTSFTDKHTTLPIYVMATCV